MRGDMELINNVLGTPLGYIMKYCYDFTSNYGVAIIIFTLITKVILMPVSILVQKNSIKMIKIKPKLDALKYQYAEDKDTLLDMESAMYKEEKYSPFAGTIPLLIQLPLILGLIDVVYRPLKHILHIPQEVITAFITKTKELSGLAELGSSPELVVMQYIKDAKYVGEFQALGESGLKEYPIESILASIQGVDTMFLGIDLASIPTIMSLDLLVLIPIFAGLSALIMCIIQNKINVLQIEQGLMAQWGMTIFMIAFSMYFTFIVPSGVGLYWIVGNVLAIPIMYLMNYMYNPKQYIDYDTLNKMKVRAVEDRAKHKLEKAASAKYYKELKSNGTMQKMKLVFYSEQSGFYKYFENVIEEILIQTDEPIYYITSDLNDKIFEHPNKQIKPYYLCETHLIPFLMKLECRVVVTTTPDWEKYHLKRSKVRKNIEYIYIDHACTTLNMMYRPGALDYFDTIFVTSRDQGIEVREMEKLRHTKKKRIVKYGYGLIDNMIASYKPGVKDAGEKPTILIAPSWQFDNILDSCLDDMLADLLCGKYKVIVRPHPQYIKRFPTNMESIIERYKDKVCDDFIIQTDFSSTSTVYEADVLITDWSAISFEYSFTTLRPTLFINTEMKILNKDYDKIPVVPFDIKGRDQIGRSIEKEETKNILAICEQMIKDKEKYADEIKELRNSYFYNLGESGKVGAEYIVSKSFVEK